MKNSRFGRRGAALPVLISVLALVLFIATLFPLGAKVLGWYFFREKSEKALLSAVRWDKGNAAYHYMLGKYYHMNLDSPDMQKAIQAYQEALRRNPLQPGVWIDLSKAFQLNNQLSEAEHALERAVKLNPHNPSLLWEAGTLYLMNNMTEKAVASLRQYLLLEPAMQSMVYDLCWKLKLENSFIMQNIVPQTYTYQSGYLSYLIAAKKAAETADVWKTLDRNSIEKKDFIAYTNFLIEQGLYSEAEAVWNEVTARIEGMHGRDAASLLWNHGFESEPLNGGFDWRITEGQGVNVFIDDTIKMTGTRSLGIVFDGRNNPDITAAQQVVPVTPGMRYVLRTYIKADGITTKNGVLIQVQGLKCTGLDMKTDSIAGSGYWKEVNIDFEVPASCSAAVVKIRRERSQKLDNKIEGTAWIDGIILKPQTATQTSSSKEHTK
ncbi:MAG: tetratricopeptide repeat protein [Nitrospirae bacterium]|nr:tetratricopeptide repeat protein [Nitrospirota bacterium]